MEKWELRPGIPQAAAMNPRDRPFAEEWTSAREKPRRPSAIQRKKSTLSMVIFGNAETNVIADRDYQLTSLVATILEDKTRK